MSPYPYLDLAYQKEQKVVLGRWLRTVMPFELKRGYDAILEEASARRCRFWLIDISQRAGMLDSSDVHWMLEEFFPQLQTRLKHTTFIAYLMAPHQLAGVLASFGQPALTYFDGRAYCVERFTNQDEALRWLEHCRREDALARRRKRS